MNNLELPVVVSDVKIKVEEASEYAKYAKELKNYLPELPKVDLVIRNYSYEVKKIDRECNNIPNIINGAYYQMKDGLGISKKKTQVVLKDINYHFKSGSSTLVYRYNL